MTRHAEALEMRKAGKTYREIAIHFGLSEGSGWRLCNRAAASRIAQRSRDRHRDKWNAWKRDWEERNAELRKAQRQRYKIRLAAMREVIETHEPSRQLFEQILREWGA